MRDVVRGNYSSQFFIVRIYVLVSKAQRHFLEALQLRFRRLSNISRAQYHPSGRSFEPRNQENMKIELAEHGVDIR